MNQALYRRLLRTRRLYNESIQSTSSENLIKSNDEGLSLYEIGIKNNTNKSYFNNFLKFYEPYFKKNRHEKIRLLEIGIRRGEQFENSSLTTWEEYFTNGEIYGIDVDESYLNYIYKSNRVKTIIGNPKDRTFLNYIEGEFDIIIDNFNRKLNYQFITFGYLFKKLKNNGIYIFKNLQFIPFENKFNLYKNSTLKTLSDCKNNIKIDNIYLLEDEKKYIQSHLNEIVTYEFNEIDCENYNETKISRNNSVILVSHRITDIKIKIYQIYYDDITKNILDKSYIPYYNQNKDNYFENSVILDIYNKKRYLDCDFIGITSPRCHEKTGLNGESLIEIIKKNKDCDVIIYTANHDHLFGQRIDVWKFNIIPTGSTNMRRIAMILNNKKYLPFDIFEKNWTFCFCNYWVAKKHIFEEYVSTVLKPTLEIMKTKEFKKEISEFNTFSHRGKTYPAETMTLEGLFGTFLSNKNYKIYNHFNK